MIWAVRSPEAGVVKEVQVSTGDSVLPGQVLVLLDTLQAANGLALLEGQYRQRLIDHRRLLSSMPIERFQYAQLEEEANAALMRARAMLRRRLAEHQLGTDVDSLLGAYQAGSHVDLDMAVADARSAESERLRAVAQIELVGLGQYEVERQLEELRLLRVQIQGARERVRRLSVVSPEVGIVLTDKVEQLVGTYVREGDRLLEVANRQHWQVVLDVAERDIHKVRVGDPVKVEIAALHGIMSSFLDGRVTHVASEPLLADSRSNLMRQGAYRVLASLDERQLAVKDVYKLRRGYAVRGKIIGQRKRIATLLREYFVGRLRADQQ